MNICAAMHRGGLRHMVRSHPFILGTHGMALKQMHGVLVGDCGGTNSRLRLFEVTHQEGLSWTEKQPLPGALIFEKTYENSSFKSDGGFCSLVQTFLNESGAISKPRPNIRNV